jgi:hypothetical protein
MVVEVQATLTGPVNGTMACQTNVYPVLCEWPGAAAVTPGAYSLQVSAAGYETKTMQVEVTASSLSCGCTAGSIHPSTVTLGSSDGGSD